MDLVSYTLPSLKLDISVQTWPIRSGGFSISRGTKTEAKVIVTTVCDGTYLGRGECVPYARYQETIDSVCDQIRSLKPYLSKQAFSHPNDLHQKLPRGAARNAIDCALWDYIAKFSKKPISNIFGLRAFQPQLTAYTLSLDTPEQMAKKAEQATTYKLLKVKLGGDGDQERMKAIRETTPNARLIADANEAWNDKNIHDLMNCAFEAKFELIEQPLPAQNDYLLKEIEHLVPICADESAHIPEDLPKLHGLYDAVNIKLDKTGGLTQAYKMLLRAKELGFKIMVGCMVGTSLAMAPAFLLAQNADWIDLDGPLILDRDRESGLEFQADMIFPPTPELWG